MLRFKLKSAMSMVSSLGFALIMVRFVLFGSMLHALERQFLIALPFRFQNLNIFSFLLSIIKRLCHVLIKKLFWKAHIALIGYITMLKYVFYTVQKTLNFKSGKEKV
jgi:hypothetical protein